VIGEEEEGVGSMYDYYYYYYYYYYYCYYYYYLSYHQYGCGFGCPITPV